MIDTSRNQESGDRLESWKQIAVYLQRDVSTVRRWEKHEGLPVRRHEHRERSSVYAIPAELDAWRDSRQPEPEPEPSAPALSFQRLVIAATLAVTILGCGWALWRTGLVRLPYPLVEAAEPGSGTTLRKLWSGADVYNVGSVSPDGRYLAAADAQSGDLMIRNIQSGETRRLTGGHAPWNQWTEYFRFSPDGKRLAYNWFNQDKQYDLRILEWSQPQPRVVYRNEETSYVMVAGWMPDGSRILVLAARSDGTTLLAFLPASGGGLQVLKSFDWRIPTHAAISPDGRFIAYDLPKEGGSLDRDIHILTTDGSRESLVGEHPATDTVVGWSPQGDRILFLSDRSGQNDLWSLAIHDGKALGNPERLKRGLELTGVLGITSKGALFYSVRPSDGDVYVTELDPATGKARGAPALATSSFPGTHSKPEWSPDGRKLAFISARGRLPYYQQIGGRRLRIRDLETSQESEQHFGIIGLTAPRWSPDGSRLIVEGRDKKGRAFFQVDLRSGKPEKLPFDREGSDPVMVAVWGMDGKSVLLGTRRIKERQAFILRHDLETGAETELYRLANFSLGFMWLYPSPDGRSIAFHFSAPQPEGAKLHAIRLIPANGGEAKTLVQVETPLAQDAIAWSADSRHLYFSLKAGSSAPGAEIWRAALANGNREFTGVRLPGINALRMHPDGRRLAFVAANRDGEIWVLENFLPKTAARTSSAAQR